MPVDYQPNIVAPRSKADKYTDGQTQADKHTGGYTDGQTQADKHTDGQTQADTQRDEQTQADKHIDGQTQADIHRRFIPAAIVRTRARETEGRRLHRKRC
jgi:uncharacterized phage infection (PIP) family protein YhgE